MIMIFCLTTYTFDHFDHYDHKLYNADFGKIFVVELNPSGDKQL